MILQALYQLAEEEGFTEDPDYEWKRIPYLIRLNKKGKFLGFVSTYYTPPQEGKKTTKPLAKWMTVPRCGERTSGNKAFFLHDKADYIFGNCSGAKDKKDKLIKRQRLFRALIQECFDRTKDNAASAILSFMDGLQSGEQVVTLPDGYDGSGLFAFVVEPDSDALLSERQTYRDYWTSVRVNSAGKVVQCLVTGKQSGAGEKLFPKANGIPGGQSSGTALVSFRENAFCSYGWEHGDNAPISRLAGEMCATALNRLLDDAYPDPRRPEQTLPKRSMRITPDTAVAYWARGKSGQEVCDIFAGIFDANPEQVGALYQSVWRGKAPQITDTSAFYALTLTGTKGRAIVRDWFETTVGDVVGRLARYFAELRIVRNRPKNSALPPQFPLPLLLESLAVRGKQENIPAPLAAKFVRAVLQGSPYPMTALLRAIERMRAEIGNTDLARRDARAAIIKAVLIRNHNVEVKEAMDPNNHDKGYLLGRLMAIIERVQQVALGEVNANVIDRFFAGASAAPKIAFPRLLKNMRHHVRKAHDDEKSRGTVSWLDKQADTILSGLDDFPGYLSLQEQGLFILGYHHQRHWLWTSKEDREAAVQNSK